MRTWQALDWIVFAIWIYLSLTIGTWIAKGFIGLLSAGMKAHDVFDALHDRVLQMRRSSPR